MKNVFILLLFLFTTCVISAQDTIFLDAKHMSINDTGVKFTAGKMITFKIENLVKEDSFAMEFTSSDVFNEAGFNKFREIGAFAKATSTIPEPFYFLSFKVEEQDYTHIKLTRFKKYVRLEERNFKYRNSGGIKFDVSAGFFVTGLKDKMYVFDYTSDSTKMIVEENTGKARVGLGLLSHLHSRKGGWFNYGACLGFEANNDIKVSYLVGGSLLFGYDKKFILNFGLALSKVDVLSNVHELGEVVPIATASIGLSKIWKHGFFAGATYNF